MKHIFNIIIIILITLAACAATLKGDWGNIETSTVKGVYDQATMPLELSPERGRYILTKSLAENQSFSLTPELADAAFPDVGIYNNKFYVYFAPGISLYVLPFYFLGQPYNAAQLVSFSSIAIFALLNSLLIYTISTQVFKFNAHAGLAAALTFSIGSFALAYATTLYQHQATAFLTLSGFYGVWQYSQKRWYGYIWGMWTWIAYGLSMWIDYPNAILLLPIMVYFAACAISISPIKLGVALSFRWSAALLSIAFIALTVAHGYYNYLHFESPTRLSGHIVGYKTILEQEIDLNSPTSTIGKLQAEKESAGFFEEERIPNGLHTLLIAADKGLFVFAPIMIIGFITMLIVLVKPRLEYIILSSVVFTHLILYSSWGDPWGGWAYGPRYMIPIAAVLAIFIARALSVQNAWKYAIRVLTLALFSISTTITWIGALTTNAVPPASEAAVLNTSYGIEYAWNFLSDDRTGSFAFNTYLKNYLDLNTYFQLLVIASVSVMTVTLAVPTLVEAVQGSILVYRKLHKNNLRQYLAQVTAKVSNLFGRKIL